MHIYSQTEDDSPLHFGTQIKIKLRRINSVKTLEESSRIIQRAVQTLIDESFLSQILTHLHYGFHNLSLR